MHAAPSVSYPVGRSRFALALLAALWVAGTAGLGVWGVLVSPAPLQVLVAVAAVLAPGAIAVRGWIRSPQGTLSWNGQDWTWSAPPGGEAGAPQAVLDVQRAMLLRWDSGHATRWLWLERGSQPARWDDLRRAVYSRAPKS